MRRRVRSLTAAGAVVVAIVYLLIGTGMVTVIDGQASAPGTPMFLAAALFLALAVATVRSGGRTVAVAGIVIQVLVIVGYVVIAPERTPRFEVWGVSLKALQVALLVGFAALLRRPLSSPAAR